VPPGSLVACCCGLSLLTVNGLLPQSVCMHGRPTPAPSLAQPLPLQDSTAWTRYGSNMRVHVPKSLIVSQLPRLHKDAAEFPLSIPMGVFEATQDGEHATQILTAAHTA
jgi:hypothetical protein